MLSGQRRVSSLCYCCENPSHRGENVKHDLCIRTAWVSTKNILQNLITESFRVKILEIIKFELWLITTLPTRPGHWLPCLVVSWAPPGVDFTTSLGSPFQCIVTFSIKKFSWSSACTSPGAARGYVLLSSHFCLEEEAEPHLTTISFQEERHAVSSEPPFLQAREGVFGQLCSSIFTLLAHWSLKLLPNNVLFCKIRKSKNF